MGDHKSWTLLQKFGDSLQTEDLSEADVISAVEFELNGDYLATGDKGGRVVLFNSTSSKMGPIFNFYGEFQSHEPEFDYLKSLEIEEKINSIRWLKKRNLAQFLLSTNDKTIKLWKILEQSLNSSGLADSADLHRDSVNASSDDQLTSSTPSCSVFPRRIYAHAHQYHINSISLNSDDETFLSADDLRINLWHIESNKESFNIVDIKPLNMEELTEVITRAEFHPQACHLFAYSTSKGIINLCDMRDSALCDRNSRVFKLQENTNSRTFFSEITSSISDLKHSRDGAPLTFCKYFYSTQAIQGRFLLSRDYLTVKIWDLKKEDKPVETYNIHERLNNNLCELYENDCIFDKFECSWDGSNQSVVTGSYDNIFRVFGTKENLELSIESTQRELFSNVNFNKKILHTTWHPAADLIALAAANNLYTFVKPVPG
ncbi:serine/threonine-protein phosphatase 2A 55 kDa regulatory subunit B delta isoform-like isoform X2 [Zophobas morio]|uniref:serine/threonine-protein phosphatase 2A 55 kDa regulatory subunit B delta isoform-like isoform X2 n=1 Tax=Zophobas morio TaxID=2755281 RepID=UPI003083E2BF